MMWSDDPVRDAGNYIEELERKAKKRPICIRCDEPIMEDTGFRLPDGWYCDRCMEDFRTEIEDDLPWE